MRHTIMATAFSLIAAAAAADTPVLSIYSYDSFVAEWGPGPQIEQAFEETCGCDVQFTGAGDGAALLARVRLEGANSDADVVLGLDTNLMDSAMQSGLFAPHNVAVPELTLPVAWQSETFLPYDWGYFAFVHNTDMQDVPGSFAELAESEARIVIQDPRSSTPGLGLLMWVAAAHGDEAGAIWSGLADNIVTVTPGWSEAYDLFLEGEADMVLSYTTSPAYHLIAEEDDSKAAAAFEEGHYLQIEVAGMLAGSDQPDLARAFLDFMLTERFQSIIPTTNWMYPAALPVDALPDGFDTLIVPERALLFDPATAAALRADALNTWLTALSR
ncbi:thiamine ABC transporter substrate binding subunit [Rhodophyticola porphyridii]|uniref:Thiamine-binding periplasmic protein n=1 Tax=Rhodophyticola porphyridii TaxID=1852017 RepID=A0A3L9YBT1_9RHOB|nr:thiamine ABC transporter substrate binding subunit [Rhodophyticola porphyridii]RMA43466.1 thiamine ABC transporter substrate binding subunit [Rhodophyticola porphyridii]